MAVVPRAVRFAKGLKGVLGVTCVSGEAIAAYDKRTEG